MIKTIDLIAQVFDETNKKSIKLEKQKNLLGNKEYNKQLKIIKKDCKKKIKQIKKQYPLDKEIDKYLMEQNDE